MQDFFDLSPKQWQEWLVQQQQPNYRASQVLAAIWKNKVQDFAEAKSLSQTLRQKLSAQFMLPLPLKPSHTVQSLDGTIKATFIFADQVAVECVAIPKDDRLTFCLSSQAGCSLGCSFCATARMELIRNLTVGEIIAQIRGLLALGGRQPTNLVFMGMGEPLLNLSALRSVLSTLTHPQVWNWSVHKTLVSTCGWVPGIKAITQDPLPAKLAFSLNAVHNSLRNQLMPVNQRFPLQEVLVALRDYQQATQEIISIEYVLLSGINDRQEDARILGRMIKNLKVKVNLIPFNPHPDAPYQAPAAQVITAFIKELRSAGILTTLRTSRGNTIHAACGQLAGKVLRRAA